MLRVRPSLPDQRRQARHLQSSLQRRRDVCACRRTTSPRSPAIQPRRNLSFMCLPGSDTLTFGMLGCDLHCAYCQNWLTSQALRDDSAGTQPQQVTAERLGRHGESLRRFDGRQQLQRTLDHRGMGRRGFQASATRKGSAPRSSQTATRRRRCSTTFAPGLIVTRLI